MEKFVTLFIPAIFAATALRMVLVPMSLVAKYAIHAGCGFLCLWLLNSVSGFTGIFFPINTVTILTAGFLGVPGIGVLALLEML